VHFLELFEKEKSASLAANEAIAAEQGCDEATDMMCRAGALA